VCKISFSCKSVTINNLSNSFIIGDHVLCICVLGQKESSGLFQIEVSVKVKSTALYTIENVVAFSTCLIKKPINE
jgi:hypothetical protein